MHIGLSIVLEEGVLWNEERRNPNHKEVAVGSELQSNVHPSRV